MSSFDKKVCIVTGAGQGIGFEICRQLCLQGASVVLNDIDESLMNDAVAKLKKESATCIGLDGDAGDVAFIQQMVNKAVGEFGKLDIVIANAGITLFADFFEYTPESFYKVMQLNLGGSFFLAQAAAKQMKQQRTGGSILFMSSVVGHQAHKNLAAYAITKAGLEMLAKNLVIELSPFNITVNAIAPGQHSPNVRWMTASMKKHGRQSHRLEGRRLLLISQTLRCLWFHQTREILRDRV